MSTKDYIHMLREEKHSPETAYKIGKLKGLVILLSLMTVYLIALGSAY